MPNLFIVSSYQCEAERIHGLWSEKWISTNQSL